MRHTRITLVVAGVTLLTLILASFQMGHDSSLEQHRRLTESTLVQELVPELWPLDSRDVIALALAALGLLLAAGGGIGGGGMLVPIYMLVLSFTPKHAIPLSNVTVFGGALANLLLNWSKRHPVATHRPLIDWDLILLMEPMTLTGAIVGANLNLLLPDGVLLFSLVLLLSVTAVKTFRKAWKMHRQETHQHEWDMVPKDEETEGDLTDTSLDVEQPPIASLENDAHARQVRNTRTSHDPASQQIKTHKNNTSENPKQYDTHVDEDHEDGIALVELSTQKGFSTVILREQLLRDERQPSWRSILTITTLFLGVLAVNLLKGGGAWNSPLGIRCGSAGFWMLEGGIVLATVAVTLYARSYLLREGRLKAQVNYVYLDTDIQWNEESTLLYPAICTVAGMVAGLFGIGGGLVKAPLLLALGVHPAVASATSATMILFTTFTATTSFVVYGMLVWDYGVLCFGIGVCATLVGQLVMNSLLERTGKTSYIAFCIAAVVLVSAVAMTAEWSYTLLWHSGEQPHDSSGFCGQE